MTEEPEPESQLDNLLRALARTPEITHVQRRLKPGTTLAGRFHVEEQLGRGGMGRVFKAYDKRRAMRVALKMLGAITPESVLQIKNEFRNAAELSHPNLVQLHELYFDGVEWLISMDLVEGATLFHVQAQHGQLPRTRLVHLMQQLALAICELHRLGILHGDLKPSNFLITSEYRVVVLDFGLARPLAGGGQRYSRSGTPGYMAPEQEAGLPLTAAADWYAFGVILSDALLGRPSDSDSLDQLRELADHEPLAQLALDLRDQDPARRPRADAVLRALGLELPHSARFDTQAHTELVGRASELNTLHTAFREMVSSANPTAVLVQGASGIGKTTLVQQFVREAREAGALVLSGRCRERESIGYKAVDVLIDDLVDRLQNLLEAEADVVIPSGIADLTRLFPALRAVEAISLAPTATPQRLDPSLARSRAIDAFTELLANLAARAPLVIWIDDLQWGDAESAPLLAPLLARAGTRVMFVATLRSLGGRPCALLDALFGPAAEIELAAGHAIELQPLSAADSTSLALRLLPPDVDSSPEIAASIAADAAGHPLFLAELARASGMQAAQERSMSLTVLMTRRIAALPPDARALVQTMALAGAPLSRTVARKAKGFAPERVERALDALRSHRLLRSDGLHDDDDLDVLHDRIREIIVMDLDEATRRSHHLELAHALVSQPSSRPDLTATHFEAGGDCGSAHPYWIQAAERAAESLAFQRASELFRRAVSSAQVGADQRRALQLREADMLALAGCGGEAARLYLEAAAEQVGHRALDLKRLAAQQLLHVGHLDRGVALADEVLRGFALTPIPKGDATLIAELMLGRLRVRLRGYDFKPRPEAELTAQQCSRIDAAWTVASSLGIIDPLRGAVLQSSHLILALDAGEPCRALRALSLEASYIAGLAGHHARTLRVMSLVERLAAQVDDRSARGRIALLRALGDYSDGNVALARQNFEFALESFAAHYAGGVFFETLTAKRFLVASLFYLGRFNELSRRLPVLLAEASSQGNLYAATTFRTHFGTVAWLVLDDVAEARRQLALARQDWTSTSFAVPLCARVIGETYLSLYTGEYREAWQRVRDFWPTVVSTRLLHIRLLKVQLWYLRAACALGAAHDAQRSGETSTGRALRKQARAAALRVRRLRSQLAEPLGELLLGCVDMDDGHTDRARARLKRCILAMDRDGLEVFGAVARMRLARLDPLDRLELEHGAHSVFERERVANSVRMQSMLAPG